MNNFDPTRRNDLSRMTEAEKAIYNAILEVEKLPADERLTEAVILLAKAKIAVGAYVDIPIVNKP